MSFQPLYKYVDRDTLAEQVRKHAADPNQREVAIVDVRDDDFEGGNIVSATNHPSSKFADEVQDLIYGPLKDYKQVIFHCHLSQQRGPKAAGQYAQARQAALETGKLKDEEQPKQEVLVLRGGFSEFQDKYKKDPAVVEKYDASAWEFRN
ncbi:related to YCH1 - phosphatase [Ustilago trichophora]|uniref:Related to YCH1 - phosphatase n=1 Tax=Ustilago trichophora TaxID=86804 RepID=A0A5C3EMT1_9BASI|nr:related to YCH1 - phosphatase [Ustilago trichophora]